MGGLFGVASSSDCVYDLFYGTDYHFHLGTRRGGMAVKNSHEIRRSIHSIENNYFCSKLEPDLPKFEGGKGIGVISDYDDQPLVIGSHIGTFAVVTAGRTNNMGDLVTAIALPVKNCAPTAGTDRAISEPVPRTVKSSPPVTISGCRSCGK